MSLDDDDEDDFCGADREGGGESAIDVDLHVHFNHTDSDLIPCVPEGSNRETPGPGVPPGSGGLSSYSKNYLNELSENTSKTLDFMYGIYVIQ